jgi:putative SOS response-associated peptidase YedK
MCGQYYIDQSTFSSINNKVKLSPSSLVPVYLNNGSKIILTQLSWGYSLENRYIINARCETLFEKKIFKEDIKKRRCVIAAKGFYQKDEHEHRVGFENHQHNTLYMCGIYNKKKEVVIITTKANSIMKPIHNRMPLIIEKKDVFQWLKDETSTKDILNKQNDNIEIVSGYQQQSFL